MKYLDFDEQFLDVDDLVPDEGLEEHAEEPHKPVLHVLVLDGLARRDAVGNVLKREQPEAFTIKFTTL